MGSSPLGNPNPTRRKAPRKRVRLLYERRISLFSLFVALPGMLLSGVFIWLQAWSLESRFALTFVELFVWWLLAMALHEQTTRPLQTLANVIAALREEDYSFRARGAATDDALGELSLEVNALADLLAEQRIRAIEATALLRRVVQPKGFVFYSDHVEGQGEAFFQAAVDRDLEGVVAKHKDSPYATGKRSKHWLKLKALKEMIK